MAYSIPEIKNALGKPVAERTTDFFLTFETITSTTPEIIDNSNYKITYIVDSEGNTQKPSEDNPSAFNILQSFQDKEMVTVILDQATSNNATLAGEHQVKFVGQPIPYLFSQNAIPSGTYEERLSFRPVGSAPSGAYEALDSFFGGANEFNTFQVKTGVGGFIDLGSSQVSNGWSDDTYTKYFGICSYSVELVQPDISVAHVSGTQGHYGFNTDPTQEGLLSLQLYVNHRITYEPYYYGGYGSNSDYSQDQVKYAYADMRMQVGNDVDGWQTYKADSVDTSGKNDGPEVITSEENPSFIIMEESEDAEDYAYMSFKFILNTDNNFRGATAGSKIRFVWGTNHLQQRDFSQFGPANGVDCSFQLRGFGSNEQSPLPDDYFVQFNGAQFNLNNAPYYWSTESKDSPWITASVKLSEFYGNNIYVPTGQQTNFGFNDVSIPFECKPGDLMRFQFNPKQTFVIYKVITPQEGGGELKVLLDRPPLTSSLQNFVMYRIDQSLASDIVLDVEKQLTIGDPENPFTGVILPKYPSENLKKNLDSILLKLKSEGILKD